MKIGLLLKNTIIFCCLLSMVYWFYIQSKAPRVQQQQTHPEEYMVNLQSTNFSVDGKPTQTIVAEYWEFNPHIGCSNLTKPKVVVYKANNEVWHLSSNIAVAWHQTLSAKITKINMQEDVLVERQEQAQITPVKVETQELEYTPETEMITSTEFVRMQQPGLVISGYGLLGYLDRNWIELHEKTTTIYTP